jgi:hypothetical protein
MSDTLQQTLKKGTLYLDSVLDWKNALKNVSLQKFQKLK